MSNHHPDDAGKAKAKKIATGAGAAIGFGVAQGIGASIAVPATATFAVVAGPVVLAAGGTALGAIGAYKLAKKLLGD